MAARGAPHHKCQPALVAIGWDLFLRHSVRQPMWFVDPNTGHVHSASKSTDTHPTGVRYCPACDRCFSANNFVSQHLASGQHRRDNFCTFCYVAFTTTLSKKGEGSSAAMYRTSLMIYQRRSRSSLFLVYFRSIGPYRSYRPFRMHGPASNRSIISLLA